MCTEEVPNDLDDVTVAWATPDEAVEETEAAIRLGPAS
jgi:hypothetical protein